MLRDNIEILWETWGNRFTPMKICKYTSQQKKRRKTVCSTKQSFHLVSSHHLLNLCNSTGRVQTLRASPRAVENSVATVHAHAVIQRVLTLGGLLITGIGQPAVGLEEDGGTEVLLAVPPVRGTGGRAAGAENAFVQTVELLALLGALAVLKTLRGLDCQIPIAIRSELTSSVLVSRCR